MTMATSPSLTGGEKKHWWLTNRKIVYKNVKEARLLIASQEHSQIASAVSLLDAALALSPRFELALEMKARSLLYLRRFKDVADMLQDYIPSLKIDSDDSSLSMSSQNSSSSSQQLLKEPVKLLQSHNSLDGDSHPSFKCLSLSDLKKKVMAGLCKNVEEEGQWRYLILGQACCHLGLIEDATILLQTGKRIATASFRRESICLAEDSFSISEFSISNQPPPPPQTEHERISQLLSHIKLLLRRKTAAIAALDAGLHSEAIRHFSKIVDSRRGAPQAFLAECYMHRASAYRSAGRVAESIADCNRTLALDPTCIEALSTRASLFETIRCLTDSLHDLEHIKLLYNSILRDRKLPGPAWKRKNVPYREIPGKLCALAVTIHELKQRVASGETGNVDYYALIGLRRGCSRSELERSHLLLTLRHKPDKANSFIDRCEFADERDIGSIKEKAKMSAALLYRLIQKGYTSVLSAILEEEAMEKLRKKSATALQAAAAIQVSQAHKQSKFEEKMSESSKAASAEVSACNRMDNNKATTQVSVYRGVFCRDIAIVGNLLFQAGFNRPIPVKYEALSC